MELNQTKIITMRNDENLVKMTEMMGYNRGVGIVHG